MFDDFIVGFYTNLKIRGVAKILERELPSHASERKANPSEAFRIMMSSTISIYSFMGR